MTESLALPFPIDGSVTADRIAGLVSLRHPTDRGEWAVFFEFEPAPAHRAGRRWDAFAIRAWRPAGWRIGYEIKVSRSDFLHELSDPNKRSAMEASCHECWFAVGPKVCTAAEVPAGWGLLELTGAGLVTRQAATQRKATPPTDDMLAAVARCAWRQAVGPDGREANRPIPKAAWLLAGESVETDRLIAVCERIVGREVDARVLDSLGAVFHSAGGRWGHYAVPKTEDGRPDLRAVTEAVDKRLRLGNLLVEAAGLGTDPATAEVYSWLRNLRASAEKAPSGRLRQLAARTRELAAELEAACDDGDAS